MWDMSKCFSFVHFLTFQVKPETKTKIQFWPLFWLLFQYTQSCLVSSWTTASIHHLLQLNYPPCEGWFLFFDICIVISVGALQFCVERTVNSNFFVVCPYHAWFTWYLPYDCIGFFSNQKTCTLSNLCQCVVFIICTFPNFSLNLWETAARISCGIHRWGLKRDLYNSIMVVKLLLCFQFLPS